LPNGKLRDHWSANPTSKATPNNYWPLRNT